MSVFTFMGSGLLRKDNDLTLSVIEQSLNTLFGIIFDEKVVFAAAEFFVNLMTD